MRVLVAGGRKYSNRKEVYEVLDKVFTPFPSKDDVIMLSPSENTEVTTLAEDWAVEHNIVTEYHRKPYVRFGKLAGPSLNARYLDATQPTVLVAFPGGKGVADLIQQAQRRQIKVFDAV